MDKKTEHKFDNQRREIISKHSENDMGIDFMSDLEPGDGISLSKIVSVIPSSPPVIISRPPTRTRL